MAASGCQQLLEMTDLSKELRYSLEQKYAIYTAETELKRISKTVR